MAQPLFSSIVLLAADAVAVLQFFLRPKWGLYDDGGLPVLVGDSCYAVDFRKESRISDYPVEGGGFESYNKVAEPYDFKMVFTKGGTDGDRQSFLDLVDSICGSTTLYSAVTKDITYENANAVRYTYERKAKDGANLLLVEVYVEEVRQTAVPTFSNTKSPDSAGVKDDGNVQLRPASGLIFDGPSDSTIGVGTPTMLQ